MDNNGETKPRGLDVWQAACPLNLDHRQERAKRGKSRLVGCWRRAWQNSNSGFILTEFDEVTNAKSLLNNVGLEFPFLALDLELRSKQRDRWCFSTNPVTVSPYCFDEYVREWTMSSAQDYVLLSHAGHAEKRGQAGYLGGEVPCCVHWGRPREPGVDSSLSLAGVWLSAACHA